MYIDKTLINIWTTAVTSFSADTNILLMNIEPNINNITTNMIFIKYILHS